MGPDDALRWLHSLFPLHTRQQALKPAYARLHRQLAYTLLRTARPIRSQEIALCANLPDPQVKEAIRDLTSADLILTSPDGDEVTGAYPLTTEPTPHRVSVNGRDLFAMCAVDALAIGAVFGMPVLIASSCRLTHSPVHIRQRGTEILEVTPGWDLRVGIRWQPPGPCAADSLCREMVFLKDAPTANRWATRQAGAQRSVFGLEDALQIGWRFFAPLLAPDSRQKDQANATGPHDR